MKKNHKIIIKVEEFEGDILQSHIEINGDSDVLAHAIAHEIMDNPEFEEVLGDILGHAFDHCEDISEPEEEENTRIVN